MIPEKVQKLEKRQILIDMIEALIDIWYTNWELAGILWLHKNVISWLRIKKQGYAISLKKLNPLLKKAAAIPMWE